MTGHGGVGCCAHPDCRDECAENCPRCTQDRKMHTSPLVTALQAAVPLWIAQVNRQAGETRAFTLASWRDPEKVVDVLCSRADIILYRGGKRGETATSFNTLAKAMAALACHQGGYNAFGLIWCAEHSPGGTPSAAVVCRRCVEQYPDAPKGCDCCTASAPLLPGGARTTMDAIRRRSRARTEAAK